MTRFLGAIAAFLLAAVVSLSAATLSIGRQPGSALSIDQSVFTVIVPPGTGAEPDVALTPRAATPISDFRAEGASSGRATPTVRTPARVVIPRATPRPVGLATGGPRPAINPPASGHRVRGRASWYCLPGVSRCTSGYRGGLYAAAGSELRIGNWRGRTVRVCGNGNCVNVKLIDSCACGGSRIIDLYNDAFRRLASPSVGTLAVTVTW